VWTIVRTLIRLPVSRRRRARLEIRGQGPEKQNQEDSGPDPSLARAEQAHRERGGQGGEHPESGVHGREEARRVGTDGLVA
jgi:hypothetical protein